MDTVLVTGGGGYLGCVLVPRLLAAGYRVRVLDRFNHVHPGLLNLPNVEDFEPVRGDCRDEDVVAKAIHEVDWVIPLAAIVGAPACDRDWREAETVNHWAIHTLVNNLRPHQRIIYPNTNSGYGKSDEVCTEDSPLKPLSWYAKTKQKAEEEVLHREQSLSLRLATAFGVSPRMRLDLLVNDLTWRAVRDGYVQLYESHYRRNFVHVVDIARAFLWAMKEWNVIRHQQVFNVVGPDGNLSKLALCETIKRVVPSFQLGMDIYTKDPDQRDCVVSDARIRKAGFWPAVTLEDGVRELVRAYTMFPPGEMRNA